VTHVTHFPYITRMTRARVTVIMRGRVTCVTSCFSWQGRSWRGRLGAAPDGRERVREHLPRTAGCIGAITELRVHPGSHCGRVAIPGSAKR
jgi:hypothetical protein